GHVEDVYAYRRKQRFSVRYGADSRPDKAFTPPSGKVSADLPDGATLIRPT
ncbi:hypothetical protein ACV1F1_29835, partial [Klebsiella pneumoniae]